MLCTSGFVDDGFSRHGANGPESSTTLYFNEVRHVAAPVGRQTTSVGYGRVHQNAAPGANSAMYDYLMLGYEEYHIHIHYFV